MVGRVYGLDFGTTNSLVSYVDQVSGRLVSFTNLLDSRPHPSVVWYRGGTVVVGRDARQWLETGDQAVSRSFVRSPKRLLMSDSPVFVDGRELDPRNIVSKILAYLRDDAAAAERGNTIALDQAVFTIPVDLDGAGRKRLREAARMAKIGVVQFVHEPLAALYGYLRALPDFHQQVADLEGRRVLVYDWGGGTLDLTLCLVSGGQLVQIANRGNNDVGGDRFDDVIQNVVLDLHSAEHEGTEIGGNEGENAFALLVNACERAKIRLSDSETAPVLVRGYLRSGAGRDIAVELTRGMVEEATAPLVARGMAEIDELLSEAGLNPQDIALVLPTGGMVNMPAIRDGLTQRFGTRAKNLKNGDRIISEGAAWIAHDGIRLTLAKPLELLQSDNSYVTVIERGFELPVADQVINVDQSMFYCTDPRDGLAHFQFARPRRVGYGSHRSDRIAYTTVSLKIDPNARPLLERIEAKIRIDADYVVTIDLVSKERNARAVAEIYALEFGLQLPLQGIVGQQSEDEEEAETARGMKMGAVRVRSNIALSNADWHLVAGDIVELYRPNHFDNRGSAFSRKQDLERNYYHHCSQCKRSSFESHWFGCDEQGCRGMLSMIDAAKRVVASGQTL